MPSCSKLIGRSPLGDEPNGDERELHLQVLVVSVSTTVEREPEVVGHLLHDACPAALRSLRGLLLAQKLQQVGSVKEGFRSLEDRVAQVDVHLPAVPRVAWLLGDVTHQHHTRSERARLEVVMVKGAQRRLLWCQRSASPTTSVVARGCTHVLARSTERYLALVITVPHLDGVRLASLDGFLMGVDHRRLTVASEYEAEHGILVLLAQASRLHLRHSGDGRRGQRCR
eukprot:7380520-Prymnesium_polylepis.1